MTNSRCNDKEGSTSYGRIIIESVFNSDTKSAPPNVTELQQIVNVTIPTTINNPLTSKIPNGPAEFSITWFQSPNVSAKWFGNILQHELY